MANESGNREWRGSRRVRVNGEPGRLVHGGAAARSVSSVVVQDGRIRAIHAVLDPSTPGRVPVA